MPTLDPVTLTRDLIRCDSVTPADGGAMDVASIERNAFEQPLAQGIHLARVLADRQMFQLADGGFGGADESVERPFPDAVQALIGMDGHEKPVLPAGSDGAGVDLGDFHASFT